MQMQIKTEMLSVVAKCRGSVPGKSAPIFLSSCCPIFILSSVCAFLFAFTSSTFGVTFASTSVENVTGLFSLLILMLLVSLLFSLFEFLFLLLPLCPSFMLLYLL